MRIEFVFAAVVAGSGVFLMAMNILICSNICFIDDFFKFFFQSVGREKRVDCR